MIEDTVAYVLVKAMRQTKAVVHPVLAEYGLHPGQDLMLSALWQQDGITQTELTERLGVEPPTVSKALRRLENTGYIRREPGRGRSRRVYVTDAGRALREPVERAWAGADAVLSGRLGREDLADLRRLLRKLAFDELAG